MTPPRKTNSYQKHIYDFIKDIYVICPSCDRQAIVVTPNFSFLNLNEHEIKLICPNCGHNKRLSEKSTHTATASLHQRNEHRYFVIGQAIDPYFHLPLWLTINCCDKLLWAYNYDHLDFLEGHIKAKIRERTRQKIENKSLGSRLPKWMTSHKNREPILKAIEQLKKLT